MTEAKLASQLADEIDDELNELRGRFVNRENDHFSFGLKFSSWDTIARALRRLAEAEAEARPAVGLRETVAKTLAGGFLPPKGNSFAHLCAAQYRADAFRITDAALSAISAAGFAVVPREPTEEMVDIAWQAACGARPVGAGDGDTYVVHPPAREDMRAALRAALTTKETVR